MKKIAFILALCLLISCAACGSAEGAGETEDPAADAVPLSDMTADDGFVDVPDGAWYAGVVAWCRENGIMDGTSESTFSPDEPMSRAMLVTVLWRKENSPLVDHTLDFSDVQTDTWYTRYRFGHRKNPRYDPPGDCFLFSREL